MATYERAELTVIGEDYWIENYWVRVVPRNSTGDVDF
jgi:hypothetical protein